MTVQLSLCFDIFLVFALWLFGNRHFQFSRFEKRLQIMLCKTLCTFHTKIAYDFLLAPRYLTEGKNFVLNPNLGVVLDPNLGVVLDPNLGVGTNFHRGN